MNSNYLTLTISRKLIFVFNIFALLAGISVAAHSQAPADAKPSDAAAEYKGRMSVNLIPDTRQLMRQQTLALNSEQKKAFEKSFGADIEVLASMSYDLRRSGIWMRTYLIEQKAELPIICIDTNNDANIGNGECLQMSARRETTDEFEKTVNLGIASPFFRIAPLYMRFTRNLKKTESEPEGKLLKQSLLAYVTGTVKIGERDTLVSYQFDGAIQSANPKSGIVGVDIDGDGKILNEPFSPETSYANNEEIVFRIGDKYLSTSSMNPATREINMRARLAEEYKKIDLKIGEAMPDFEFADFEDKKRTLSEFRGKYVLIDFWGLWCADCVRDLPYQREAYKIFNPKGLEILGINTDENSVKAKPAFEKNGVIWPQAKNDSIRKLVEEKYRIQEYPSAILLDPQGKVLVLDQGKLSGPQLSKTLAEFIK